MFKFNKKKLFLYSSFILVFVVVGAIIFNLFIFNFVAWFKVKSVTATGGYSYVIGLSGSTVIPCFTTGTPPVCAGGTLCYVRDVARCTLYSDVSGAPAGGMSNALFLTSNLSSVGVVEGGPIIAGGMSMTEMDNGVVAGPGGCMGASCTAKIDENDNIFVKTAKKFANFMIAGIKQ